MKLSFGASYIKPVEITQKQGVQTTPLEASLVELDVYDRNDFDTLDKTAADWGSRSFLFCIWDEIDRAERNDVDYHVYAVTTQKDSFDKLDNEKILGACLFNEYDQNNELDLLQVQPDNLSTLKSKNGYRRVGSAIVNSLKTLYPDKPICVYSDYEAVDFYRKCGFESSKDDVYHLVWNA